MSIKKLVVLSVLLTVGVILAGCSSQPEPANITIEMSEYAFAPNRIELEVGQEVTITLVNIGELDHEFMIGQGVVFENAKPSGYQVDFFTNAGVTPAVTGGGMLMDHGDEHSDTDEMEPSDDGMDMSEGSDDDDMGEMDMSDGSTDGDDHDDDDMDMDMVVNMVMLPAGADFSTITFTVTEAMVGEWELGCFELDGLHYTEGMHGILVVKP